MKMLFCSLILVLGSCIQLAGQVRDGEVRWCDSAVITLRKYEAKKCLREILKAIAASDVDSVRKRYPPELYCFNVLISESTSYSSLLIIPQRWSVDLPHDCLGLIEVGGRTFMCCGDCRKTELIVDTKRKINKRIAFSNNKIYDSLEDSRHIPDWEKSPTKVVGILRSCAKRPVTLHIDIGTKIEALVVGK